MLRDMHECKHASCVGPCSKPKKEKKVYKLNRTPIKQKPYTLKRTPIKKKRPPQVNRSVKVDKVFTLPELLLFTQAIFNKWIRERDKYTPCISSGIVVETIQAGHYKPAGSYSGVRFDEINVNGQSVEENCFKGGNEKEYRNGLIARYGLEKVEALEKRAIETRLKKWTRAELTEIINKYKL